jgi:hypothetical protein
VAKKGEPIDIERTLVAEGRREVWLRIENHLRLNQEQLYTIYAGQQFQIPTEDDDD